VRIRGASARPRPGLRRLTYCTVAVTAGVIAAGPFAVDAAVLGQPDFQGKGQGGSEVAFRIKAKNRVKHAAIFEARNVELFCEDLTRQRVTLDPVKVPFRNPRRFRREIYSLEPNGDESFYEVTGSLRGRGRARGSLQYVSDPVNPPGSGAPPDCDSLSVSWRAGRT
jgi:hypothetical protein